MGQFSKYLKVLQNIRFYADDPQPTSDVVRTYFEQYKQVVSELVGHRPNSYSLMDIDRMREDLLLLYQILEQERANEMGDQVCFEWLRGTPEYQYIESLATYRSDVHGDTRLFMQEVEKGILRYAKQLLS